jgi:hypothetical protein
MLMWLWRSDDRHILHPVKIIMLDVNIFYYLPNAKLVLLANHRLFKR